MRASTLERFEEKYIPEPNSGCWLWVGGLSSKKTKPNNTYGVFRHTDKPIKAHRASWMIYKGEVGDSCVLHKCDNPLCVNPDHLFLGTHNDNMKDMKEKGRAKTLKGEDHPNSKLTKGDVVEIKKMLDSGHFTLTELADLFDVSDSLIWNIKNNIGWNL